jgi:hypothetical protein
MTKAEVLHLDCQDEAALRVISAEVLPLLTTLPEDVALVARENEAEVKRNLWHLGMSDETLSLRDEARVGNLEITDFRAHVFATSSAVRGEHYDAISALWGETIRTYRLDAWLPHRWARSALAEELLRVGRPVEAVAHAVVGLDPKLAKSSGENVLRSRAPDRIRRVLSVLTATANLQRLFACACEVILALSDGVPDDYVGRLLSWVLPSATRSPDTPAEVRTVLQAWRCIEAFARRLDNVDAVRVVEAAIRHSCWGAGSEIRRVQLRVVRECVEALDHEGREKLVETTLAVVTRSRHDLDYVEAVNLAVRLADLGGEELKKRIGDRLFAGTSGNAILAQVATRLGRTLISERFQEVARGVAADIRREVERLDVSQEPERLGGELMLTTVHGPGEPTKLVVHVMSHQGLRAILVNKESLDTESVTELVDAMLGMISERENFFSNRAVLIDALASLSERLTSDQKRRVREALQPLAEGNIAEPSRATPPGAGDPLSRFRYNLGSRSEVQGLALSCLVRLAAGERVDEKGDLVRILGAALSDENDEVRAYALLAARDAGSTSPGVVSGLLVGTRDPSARAASTAFAAIAANEHLSLTERDWALVLQSAEFARQSDEVERRRAGSFCVARILKRIPRGPLAERAEKLHRLFAEDVCYSVRQAAIVP